MSFPEKNILLQVMTSGLFSCVIAIRELGFDFGKMVKFWFPGERGCYKPAPVPVRHRPAPVHGGIPWLLSISVLQNNTRPYHKTDFPPYHPQLGPYHTITPHLMFNSEHPILYQEKQLRAHTCHSSPELPALSCSPHTVSHQPLSIFLFGRIMIF